MGRAAPKWMGIKVSAEPTVLTRAGSADAPSAWRHRFVAAQCERNMPVRKLSEASTRGRILLVDDNSNGLKARKSVLEEHGHRITTARGGEEALDVFSRQKFELVITDYQMPGMDGLELICQLRKQVPEARIILLSGFVDSLGFSQENTGADCVIQKSANEVQHLVRAVSRLLQPKKPPAGEQALKARRKAV